MNNLRPTILALLAPMTALSALVLPRGAGATVINTGLGFALNITTPTHDTMYIIVGLGRLLLGLVCVFMVINIVHQAVEINNDGERTESLSASIHSIVNSVICMIGAMILAGVLPSVAGVAARFVGQA
ncbi:MAG: hypothetical protein PHT12_00615 [Patescibacteria group bacterium]|nr:hypothetical protein [Patescibacteria group bacterium]